MDMLINLVPQRFGTQPDEVFRNADFVVTAVDCAQAGPMLTLENSRGSLRVLPYSGMTIWDADFDGYSLKSGRRSVKAARCHPHSGIAFHSPWPYEDGSSSELNMQRVALQLEGNTLTLYGSAGCARR
ncbi:hypothetical protein D3C81_160330 [compost metagenome]